MRVIPLSEIAGDMLDLVGGKATGLGELIRRGERVPDGFCLTTVAHREQVIPEAEVLSAYERLGSGPVAVRSSATAEDLPYASFAGQQDTFLQVTGVSELLAAIRKCWDSLHAERAIAYREANEIDHDTVRMAVVVQRMVDPVVAGVLFSANPLTGRRTEMVVDAAPGLGTAVVDGTVVADHYVLDGATYDDGKGCLTRAQLAELHQVGQRLQGHFGAPQDIEWAIDGDGTLWLLQSRPITTLFPLPPENDLPLPRIYVEFGHVQGMLQPATPMGMSALKVRVAGMFATFGFKVEIVDIGGRLYGDLTDLVRNPAARTKLVRFMAVDFGPRAQAVVEWILTDPRFSPQKGGAGRTQAALGSALRTAQKAVAGILGALVRPDAARIRMFREIEAIRQRAAAPAGLSTSAERLSFVEAQDQSASYDAIIWPIVTGLMVASMPAPLLKGIASDDDINTVLGGMPYNVTIEMDLALWRLAQNAAEHRDLLLTTPPDELAARYLAGTLPDIGLSVFLDTYGHRAAAEVDVGVPRWEEAPAPVFAMIANYLRVTDPEQAPDQRFERAAAAAEAKLAELRERVRRSRPIRGRLAVFFLRRARALSGLREAGKFTGLYALREIRRQLLLVGADLAERGLLEGAGDIMFLTIAEARSAVDEGADHREIVLSRKAVHERELRRRSVPVAILSDGTDVETLLPAPASADGALKGVGAAAGRATGRARVVRDLASAHLEPGEILVAPTTDPGWTPLFLTAGGLVTETGAPMAHGPTVAREYGIPAVICVPAATEKIQTGQVITVDGAAGTVSFDP
ncbi:PEP/pyruvate-binding domain-containing protein [Actinopolymorpha alba]|uniref:PEP/pyruvate-binding domain-containing protein n=1 Tax=Actinopolymorpha alba TaxID=533267 RepID=UPI00035D9CD8|nr:PEP/pyruvate-binding domain-containing protein [Actinopolymorpha alba]